MVLKDQIITELRAWAKACQIQKLILFGSRARGDCHERSDINLAASGGNIRDFRLGIDEEIRTLLMFDVVNLDGPVQKELLEEIKRDGVVLYEEG